jgi:GGDEF domain-containing protein
MFLARIKKVKPNVLIYNYKPDALILAFKNYNVSECFDFAEDIRRLIAKSVFVFNENNHLQLTVSQCVSEKKRSDAGAAMVLERAEENLKKACKFTHNITVRA